MTSRQLERALGPQRGDESLVQRDDLSRRAPCGDESAKRVNQQADGTGPVATQALGDTARILEEVDGLLILELGSQLAGGIHALRVLFNGDADDAREPSRGVLLRTRRGGRREDEPDEKNRSRKHSDRMYRDCRGEVTLGLHEGAGKALGKRWESAGKARESGGLPPVTPQRRSRAFSAFPAPFPDGIFPPCAPSN